MPSAGLSGTVKLVMVGARFRRSSSASTARRHRAGALRMVRGEREANRLRSQERVVMESLLPRKAAARRKKGTASLALTQRQAGKALTALSQPPGLFVSSMRNRERNYATK